MIVPDSNDWHFGSGDFTIDGWINLEAGSTLRAIVTQGDQVGSFGLFLQKQSTTWQLLFAASATGSQWDVYSGYVNTPITENNWHHVAWVRSGNTWTSYVDGQTIASLTDSMAMWNSPSSLKIGYYHGISSDYRYLGGYLDEFRISKGIARWTTNFTPPDAPYSVVAQAMPVITEDNYSNFKDDPETTVFTSEPDPTNITAPIIANTLAKIAWTGSGFNAIEANINDAIIFGTNSVFVDSSVLTSFNRPATITFRQKSFADVTNYIILKDDVLCSEPDCVKISSSPVAIEVSGFSNYTVQDNTPPGEIPEFNVFTITIGLMIVAVGLIIHRRHQLK